MQVRSEKSGVPVDTMATVMGMAPEGVSFGLNCKVLNAGLRTQRAAHETAFYETQVKEKDKDKAAYRRWALHCMALHGVAWRCMALTKLNSAGVD
jgi:hypothetical protein